MKVNIIIKTKSGMFDYLQKGFVDKDKAEKYKNKLKREDTGYDSKYKIEELEVEM